LLREGLDLPEVELVSILDADKQGFLRSETSLIQTIGRAARNVNGRVVLYADQMTSALTYAIGETNRRREIQVAYNTKHGITPTTVIKNIKDITAELRTEHQKTVDSLVLIDEEEFARAPKKVLASKRELMEAAVQELDFETAALIRDEIRALEARLPKRVKGRAT
jgi:excinuclease ABC subunit B